MSSSANAQRVKAPPERQRSPYDYAWPTEPLTTGWRDEPGTAFRRFDMPEEAERVAQDSRWPAFFPAPLCVVTTGGGSDAALEKVVGASIVNRFPYTIALSFCHEDLSPRHYARRHFMEQLAKNGSAVVQFLPPGPVLDAAMSAIARIPDEEAQTRIAASGLATEPGARVTAPVFTDAYLAYECRLVRPTTDFEGRPIFEKPWRDVGSHRIFFLEIEAIQLDAAVADGRTPIRWRSLPSWTRAIVRGDGVAADGPSGRYTKKYTPNYVFPSANTIAFEADETRGKRAVKYLPPLPADQVEVDNDRARWPCFFPSSLGMITSWDESGRGNIIPCGSTTIVSRRPLVISPCISYAAINERYAPRDSLDRIRRAGRFGCGVAYDEPTLVDAISYLGNISFRDDPDKAAHAGLPLQKIGKTPLAPELPIHFDCRVIGEETLGTHIMFFGEVERIYVRREVTAENPMLWNPWAAL